MHTDHFKEFAWYYRTQLVPVATVIEQTMCSVQVPLDREIRASEYFHVSGGEGYPPIRRIYLYPENGQMKSDQVHSLNKGDMIFKAEMCASAPSENTTFGLVAESLVLLANAYVRNVIKQPE